MRLTWFMEARCLRFDVLRCGPIALALCLWASGMAPVSGQTPPNIVVEPVDQSVCIGSNAIFYVEVTGTPPINFHWFSNGIPVTDGVVSSQTNSSLTITNVQPANDGDMFFVAVTSTNGFDQSTNAFLLVPDPAICEQPTNTVVPPGGNITFSVVASGSPPLYYQWFKTSALTNDTRISGADTPMLTISNALLGDTGFYYVEVTNHLGSVTSILARCDVATPPAIVVQPVSQVARFATLVQYFVGVTGTLPRSYQWYRNDVPIPGAVSQVLILTNVQRPEVGLYHAVVTNVAGMATSKRAHLQVRLTLEGDTPIPREEATDVLTSLTNAAPSSSPPPTVMYHGVPLLFTTYGASADSWESAHCGVPASHSMWVVYYSPRQELTKVSTEGSTFDTVAAVYTWSGNTNDLPMPVDCNNDGGYDVVTSRFYFPAQARTDYYIAVDGVGGAAGTVRLEVGETIRKATFNRTNGTYRFEMAGPYWADNYLQSFTNLAAPRPGWPVELTVPATNRDWVVGYTNFNALADGQRFYSVGINTNSTP